MDEVYWCARLRAVEERFTDATVQAGLDDIGGIEEYRRGYLRGRQTAWTQAIAEVRRLRRDLAASAAQAAR